MVSCVGSFLEVYSKWLDHHMASLLHLVPSRLKDSNQVLDELRNLGQLPFGAKELTADAKAMYTHIDPDHAIEVMKAWFREYSGEIPVLFPRTLFIEVLRIVLKRNIFQSGDTFWRQIVGTA